MSKSYVILGANGQLGMALQQLYPQARALTSDDLDITDRHAVDEYDWSDVDVIINAAAYTNVDGAETPDGRKAAWAVNASSVASLAKVAASHGAVLVHVSSDYVFDGGTSPHMEDEPLSPLSHYGASKAAGDIATLTTPKHYLLRTTWVVGDGNNFVRTMLGLAGRGISPTVVSDQIGRLTFTSELVRAVDHLLITQSEYGIYNVTNDGQASSWADITRRIFELSGHGDLTVTDTSTAEYFAGKDGVAPRPLHSEMNLDKLHSTGFESRDWEADLQEYIQKENQS